MSSSMKLNIVIVGGGLAGLSAALGLRRQGHQVSVYDKSDFVGEVGSGLGIMPNAARILEGMWEFDISSAHPVVLSEMVMRDYATGKVVQTSHVGDFKGKFGYDYYGLIRLDLHQALLKAVTANDGEGSACKLFVKHRLQSVNAESGTCTFENGLVVTADLVVGADGIQSCVRSSIGVHADVTYSNRSCFRMVISLAKLQQMDMLHLLESKALTLWPGPTPSFRVIAGASHDGEMLSVYAIFPTDREPETTRDYWQNPANPQDVIDKFPDIDPKMHDIFREAEDLHVWRYVVHEPYDHRTSGKVALIGDAAHPMFPDQNQGYSQAVEDAAALSLIFSPEYAQVWNGHVDLALKLYEKVRKDRATTVQNASLAASKDFRARFGFKHSDDPPDKLTLEWLCEYEIEKHVAQVMAEHKSSG